MQKERFFGDKAHMSFNAEAELITGLVVASGNGNDGRQCPTLVEKDLSLGLPVGTVAYDDSRKRYLPKSKRLHSAICLNWHRTERKDKNQEGRIVLRQTTQCVPRQKQPYSIWRKFRETKQGHGLG